MAPRRLERRGAPCALTSAVMVVAPHPLLGAGQGGQRDGLFSTPGDWCESRRGPRRSPRGGTAAARLPPLKASGRPAIAPAVRNGPPDGPAPTPAAMRSVGREALVRTSAWRRENGIRPSGRPAWGRGLDGFPSTDVGGVALASRNRGGTRLRAAVGAVGGEPWGQPWGPLDHPKARRGDC